MKLTLGQAAVASKRAKGTLSKALTSGQISAEKDEKGRWQIDPSELGRWMDANQIKNGNGNGYEAKKDMVESNAVEVELKMLRDQISTLIGERERERGHLVDQIEDLRTRLDSANAERMRLNAILTDQRLSPQNTNKPNFWFSIFRRK